MRRMRSAQPEEDILRHQLQSTDAKLPTTHTHPPPATCRGAPPRDAVANID